MKFVRNLAFQKGATVFLSREIISIRRIGVSLCILCFIAGNAHATDSPCGEMASKKIDESTYLVCGIFTAGTEVVSREQAALAAQREYALLCDPSADCREYEFEIEPLRTNCTLEPNGAYKCARSFYFSVNRDRKRTVLASPSPPRQQITTPPARVFQPHVPQPQPVADPASTPWEIGISAYRVAVTRPNKQSNFSGPAAWFSYAHSPYVASRFGYYLLESTKSGASEALQGLKASGWDLQFLIGRIDRAGWRLYFGGGIFNEEWKSSMAGDEPYRGLAGVYGAGYNWSHVTVELAIALRNSAEYGDQATASSGSLMLSTRW